MREVIPLFDLPQILRHNARFDLAKLDWLNGEYLREMSAERFRELALRALARAGIAVNTYSEELRPRRPRHLPGQNQSFADLPDYGGFYFSEEMKIDAALAEKVLTTEARERLGKLRAALAALPEFKAAALEQTLKAVAAELGIKAGPLVHPTRLALTGREAGPSLYHLMEVLGRDLVLRRLKC